ncbi:hypothetical protein DFH09DRAFT_1311190 [Mycena vulgaris]|nr:hypothetical protein DFH09DRAFT_1311190 [Mycena vulgaris]
MPVARRLPPSRLLNAFLSRRWQHTGRPAAAVEFEGVGFVGEAPPPEGCSPSAWLEHQLLYGGVSPPPPATLDPAQLAILGEKAAYTINTWNRRPVADNIVFYHNPATRQSQTCLKTLRAAHGNATAHPAPFRFVLTVRAGPISPDLFRELLYRLGQASFQLFLNPHRGAPVTVPTAAALHALLAREPERRMPILQHLRRGCEPAVYLGHKAVTDCLVTFEERRLRQLGPAVAKLIQDMRRGPTKVKKCRARAGAIHNTVKDETDDLAALTLLHEKSESKARNAYTDSGAHRLALCSPPLSLPTSDRVQCNA